MTKNSCVPSVSDHWPPGTTSAIAYFRVSKKDGTQSTANQKPEVEALAAGRGFTITATYEDSESAVKRRPGLEALLIALRKGRHGPKPVVLLWSLDRLGRGLGGGGLAGCFDTYRALVHLGARVISAREPWLDVEGPARDLLVAILSWVSGWERDRLIERTKAGLVRAKKEGKRLGRRPVQLREVDLLKALELKALGWGARRIVPELSTRLAPSTLDKVLAQHGPKKGHQDRGLQPAGMTAAP